LVFVTHTYPSFVNKVRGEEAFLLDSEIFGSDLLVECFLELSNITFCL
jgi:hypothetical protein